MIPVHDVLVHAGSLELAGDLRDPRPASGLVVFAHGSGSSRRSPRNVAVAESLHRRRYATLLFDLLSPAEEALDRQGGGARFDIALLAERLGTAVRWVRARPDLSPRPLGLFGASTGAAAALVTAANRPGEVDALVSRGGRPDLAGEALAGVRAPSLLIVGQLDTAVLELNRLAGRRLHCAYELAEVAGATHLFEEPGALEAVADLAGTWFDRYLSGED